MTIGALTESIAESNRADHEEPHFVSLPRICLLHSDEDACVKIDCVGFSAFVTEPSLKGIVFCGDDIEVASVVLRHSVRNKKEMDAKLKQLKDTGIRLDRRTVGFMFACVGRGHHLHRATNVEADIFKRHFPGVPLFGFFGNGEIGYDYLPDYTSEKKDTEYSVVKEGFEEQGDMRMLVCDMPEVHLSYSTIFVILSLPPT